MVDKYNPGSRSDHGANVHGFILISSLYPNHTTILIIFHYIPLYPIISHYIYISHYIPWYPMISHYIPLYPIISLYPIYPCFMLIMLLFKSPFLTVKNPGSWQRLLGLSGPYLQRPVPLWAPQMRTSGLSLGFDRLKHGEVKWEIFIGI